MKYILLTLFLTSAWSQYQPIGLELKPDVTFDEDNDRFDISAMMKYTNRFVEKQEHAEEDEDYRRRANVDIELLVEELKDKVRNNKDFTQFSYQDEMRSDEGGNGDDYERSLKKFQNNRRLMSDSDDWIVRRVNRRSGDRVAISPDKEKLFNYAVPVVMKINGYIQAPLVE